MELCHIDFGVNQGFLEVGCMCEALPVRIKKGEAPPEVEAVFITYAIGMGDEDSEEVGLTLIDLLDPTGRFKFRFPIQSSSWGSGGE